MQTLLHAAAMVPASIPSPDWSGFDIPLPWSSVSKHAEAPQSRTAASKPTGLLGKVAGTSLPGWPAGQTSPKGGLGRGFAWWPGLRVLGCARLHFGSAERTTV
ncbi:hypothetical protein EYS21_18170 [Arthrobacter sp. S39]|nr:hypothetical protein EYS21_18170 [Arthrobacter sp. S39]